MNKVLHYCWFGGNPLGEKERLCIRSWKKYFPDYKIKRWDESNFDIKCCDYVAEAYRAEKWAFVADYARFAILYEHGGIYFDTDVEVIKSFDDVLARGPFMGLESDPTSSRTGSVAPGLGLAANPGLGLYATIIDSYDNDHFILPDGRYNYYTVVQRVTDILVKRGLHASSEPQRIDGITVYPSRFFNPIDMRTGELHIEHDTHSIHHYCASWQPDALRQIGLLKQAIYRRMPILPAICVTILSWLIYLIRTRDFESVYERIRMKSQSNHSETTS